MTGISCSTFCAVGEPCSVSANGECDALAEKNAEIERLRAERDRLRAALTGAKDVIRYFNVPWNLVDDTAEIMREIFTVLGLPLPPALSASPDGAKPEPPAST